MKNKIRALLEIADHIASKPESFKEVPDVNHLIVYDSSVQGFVWAHTRRAVLLIVFLAVIALVVMATTLPITAPAAIIVGELTARDYTQMVSYEESNGVITIGYNSKIFSDDGLKLCVTQPGPEAGLTLGYINSPLGESNPWDWLCFENQDTIVVTRDQVILDPISSVVRPQLRLAKIVTAKYVSDWYMMCWWEDVLIIRCTDSIGALSEQLDR